MNLGMNAQVKLSKGEQKAFSPTDLLSMNRAGDPQVSPDGKWVLYSLGTPSIEDNKIHKDLYVVSIDGLETIQVTDHPAQEFHARWIEGGKKIAFLSTRMGSPQIFTKEFPDGHEKGLTTRVGGIGSFRYSPDGTFIAFSADVKIRETTRDKYPDYRQANVKMYESLPVRAWDHWEDENFSHLFLMPSGGGPAVDIMTNEPYDVPLSPFGGTENYGWAPNSKELAYACKKVDMPAKSTNTDIYVYDLKSKITSNITSSNLGYDKDPVYSPDGKYIAYISQERAGFEADKVRLMVYEQNTKVVKELTKSLDQWVKGYIWSPDSKSMYFNASEKGREPLFSVDVASSEIKKIAGGNYNYSSGLDVTPDGNILVFGRTSMTQPTDFYSLDLTKENSSPNQLSRVNSIIWVKIKDIKIEDRIVETTDGLDMHVWVLFPPDFDASKKYPMITYCQGGPQGTISNYFSYRWNLYLMASQGYIVCAPNRRGMPGFGQKWNDDISKDWGGQAMDDILSATDAVAKESYVDNKKIGCVGASFGGYTAFWMAAHHEGRFATFISHCGVYNLTSMYGSTEELFFPDWEYGGPFWEEKNEDQYKDFSPHNYVNKWNTPMLVITGLNDFRVPYTQSLEAFTALQAQGIESKLMVFPNESHWVLKPQNALVWQAEFFGWLDKYCK